MKADVGVRKTTLFDLTCQGGQKEIRLKLAYAPIGRSSDGRALASHSGSPKLQSANRSDKVTRGVSLVTLGTCRMVPSF